MRGPDRAMLLFLAEESRRIVRIQVDAGSELSAKAEAIVKSNGLLFGLILTAMGMAASSSLGTARTDPPWLWWSFVASGPVFLLLSMLCGVLAFRCVDFEIGLSEAGMLAALAVPLREAQTLRKAVETYAGGIQQNKASIDRVETLIGVALLSMAIGVCLALAAGLMTWLGNGTLA